MSLNSALKLRILIFMIFFSIFGCQNASDGDVSAPDFSLSDLSGRVISLKQYRGNVVILDFWATWCMPCRVSIPELGKLHEKYRDKGLVVLGISMDDREQFTNEHLRAFRDKFGITYKILRYNINVIRDYFGEGSIAIPTMFLIDRKGKIREKIVGFRPDVLNKSLIDLL
jgi:cytochrome c biogenesis protein CcmG/thiol:disulfide interchange protein DsbE